MPPRCCRSRISRSIATGRGYAGYLDPKNTSTRYDAVMQSGGRDSGVGVPYQTEYCLQTGRDGATRSGSRTTAAGSRVPTAGPRARMASCASITERHDHERAACLSVAFRRAHRRDESQCVDRGAHNLARRGGEVSRLVRLHADRGRQSGAHQRGLRLRRRRRGDRLGRAAHLRSRMRGGDMLGRFSSNKFGVVLNTCTPDDLSMAADRFLAAVREDVVQTAQRPGRRNDHDRRRSGAAACAHGRRRYSRMRRNRSIPPRRNGAARSSPTGRISSARRCARRMCARPTRSSLR